MADRILGDSILNIFFFLPTQFFIMNAWKKNKVKETSDIVKMKRLTWKQNLILFGIGIAVTFGFGLLLNSIDHFALNVMKRNVSIYGNIEQVFGFRILGPVLDSSTEFLQIGAQILLILRYAEQWILWMLTNIITIAMWIAVIATDKSALPYAVPTLVMWVAYLINSIYGYYVWRKNSRKEEV